MSVAQELRRELALHHRSDGQEREAVSHLVSQCIEDLFGEEPVERLRHGVVAFDLGRRDARETDDRGPPVCKGDESRCRHAAPVREHFGGLLVVHRERRLVYLEDVAVENAPGGDPGWPLPGGKEKLKRAACEQVGDERFGLRGADELLVVVDDEPRFARPLGEILAEDFGEDRDVPRCSRDGAHVLTKSRLASLDDGGRRTRNTERERGDIHRRASRRVPRRSATSACDPLLGERGLTVACGGEQGAHTSRRFVEQSQQAWTLDDAAPLESAHIPDRGRHPPPSRMISRPLRP